MIVVDSNIIAQFWLSADQSELCDEIFRKDPVWVSPISWKGEFRTAVSLCLKKKLIEFAEAIRVMERAEGQMFDREFIVNSVQVLSLADRSACSAGDCEYVALAKELNTRFITMDKQVLKEFPELALSPDEFLGSKN